MTEPTQPELKTCARCIMDTSDPDITFDDQGVCHHCRKYDALIRHMGIEDPAAQARLLEENVARIKDQGKGREYDCIVGLSGGVDSSYLAYLAKKSGLRPLAVHVDAGWNSELAVRNIELLVKKIGIDLYTFVVEWEEMRDLQLAFLKSSVANQDIPQDHVFMAAVHRVAAEKGIKTILGGSNISTESILPSSWGYNARDLRHLKSIHRKFGTVKLKTFPTMSFFASYVYYPMIKKIETVHLLNYIPYEKKEAMRVLQEELGWRYYGGKHYESVFTKFFQSYYLPVKFGFDKRKAHLSSLIVSGQMSRDEALHEMKASSYNREQVMQDKVYVSKKLGISLQEFDAILEQPIKTYQDYPSNEWLFRLKDKTVAFLKGRPL